MISIKRLKLTTATMMFWRSAMSIAGGRRSLAERYALWRLV
jgi:hypothetical protein